MLQNIGPTITKSYMDAVNHSRVAPRGGATIVLVLFLLRQSIGLILINFIPPSHGSIHRKKLNHV